MRHLRTRLLLALVGASLLIGPVAAPPAAASSEDRGPAALPVTDQAWVLTAIRRLRPLHVTTRGGPLPGPPAAMTRAAGTRPAVAARERCWYRYWYYDWGTFGVVMAHTWMTLNWCGDGTRVTRWSRGAVGGTSSVAGLSYRGIAGRGALHVGWEVRAYTQFLFSAGLGLTIDTTPCQQIRGGAGGLYSQRDTCDLR